MKCPRKFLVVGLSIAFLMASAPAMPQAAQEPPPSDQGGNQPPAPQAPDTKATIRSNVSIVVVPVTVKNRAGSLVTDLQKSDFRIFEDGIEQPISSFSSDPFPLSAAILLDDNLKKSVADKMQKTLQAIGGGFSSDDEVALWRFDEVPQELSDFITNNDTLVTQLKRIDLNGTLPGFGSAVMTEGPRVNSSSMPGPPQVPAAQIGTNNHKHIDDAIYAAADQLRTRGIDRRKIIFVISDGQNAKNNTHSYNETLKLLLSQGISVYAIGLDSAIINRGPTIVGGNVLAKYAHSTGGDIYYAPTREDMEKLYSRISEQARNQYTLTYSGARTDRGKLYHTIEVRVKRPDLYLLARDGYYLNAIP